MEKNQHNSSGAASSSQEAATSGVRPGQQLPAENTKDLDEPQESAGNMGSLSESSLPQSDEETLGTP